MGAPRYTGEVEDLPSHAWTCHCGKRIIAFLNAVWPGETWRTEESKFNAAIAAHQMECSGEL